VQFKSTARKFLALILGVSALAGIAHPYSAQAEAEQPQSPGFTTETKPIDDPNIMRLTVQFNLQGLPQGIICDSRRSTRFVAIQFTLNGNIYDWYPQTDCLGRAEVDLPNGYGQFELWAKADSWLAARGSFTWPGPGYNLVIISDPLDGGDANADNIINIVDFNVYVNTFGCSWVDSCYQLFADIDRNHFISVTDFNIFQGNHGNAGAPPIH